MAKVIGTIISDKWEREVVNQMRQQLPDSWIVIQNVQWTLNNGKYVRDGQCDIVVLVPNLGLVVIEVKGSKEIKVSDDGRWYRREKYDWILIDEPPPEQASRNMHTIIDLLTAKLNIKNKTDFPGSYAYLVAYPNGKIESSPAMYDSSTIISQIMMNQLQSRLRNALLSRKDEKHCVDFDSNLITKVSETLTNQKFSVVKCDTNLDVGEDLVNVDVLTAQQFSALKGVFEHPRVAVAGPAGSGKTLLAIWRLQALLDSGKRAIYVCFNKKLASVLRKKYEDCSEYIYHVDALFGRIAPGNRATNANVTNFSRNELPELVLSCIDDMTQNDLYDAILVDEGQDFSENQLIALYGLLKTNDAQWNLFADYNQDLYHLDSNKLIGCDVLFKLSHNCRNTSKVNSATNGYLKNDVPSMPGIAPGFEPVVNLCNEKSLMASQAWNLAKQWQNNEGVVILSPYTLDKSSMAGYLKGHGLTLIENLDKLGDSSFIFFSTIKGFKGIEVGAVIFIDADVPSDKGALQKEDVYVACTRPMSRLAVLCKNQNALSFYKQTRVG